MKAIWLYRHGRELADPPSEFQRNIFNQGKEVGELATKLFPKGVLISADHTQGELAIEQTREAIRENVEAIFEAGFQFQNVLVRVDILKNNFDGTWDLIEVKSTNSVEPKAHYDDVAIQKWVLINSGVRIKNANLMHLNRDYQRNGNLDLTQLFVSEPLDALIGQSLSAIESYLPAIQTILNQGTPPIEEIGAKCSSPYQCEFTTHCWSHVGPDSIHSLGRISDSKRRELRDLSVDLISEIPDSFKLTDNQQVETKAHKERDVQIDLPEIKEHLSKLTYPLYYLDYESVAYAVPRYDGNWPHKQLTTQYSLHAQEKPNGALKHLAYLHDEETNPSRSLANQLIKDIKDDGGSIIVYHMTFERDRTKELAEEIPELSHQLNVLISRMWDLEIPFAKRWYWDHRFEGSSSIKNVLPVFKPEFSYEDLKIKKGDQAQQEFAKMIKLAKGHPERESIRSALLDYCARDSMAMCVILTELLSLLPVKKSKQAV
jgi:hypothetical protein